MEKIYHKVLEGAGMWSGVIGRHKVLRLTDIGGGANVGAMFYHARQTTERYNMPDTLKGQQIFYLSEGKCLHTDMGRVMASITDDTAGWHDTVGGTSRMKDVREVYGDTSFQEYRNEWKRGGAECFLVEMLKWGLDRRDWMPNVNFFSKIVANEDGGLHMVEEDQGGRSVSLRMEMDCLVILNTCQHPMDRRQRLGKGKVELEVFSGMAPGVDDLCRNSHPENGRAMQNSEDYYLLG